MAENNNVRRKYKADFLGERSYRDFLEASIDGFHKATKASSHYLSRGTERNIFPIPLEHSYRLVEMITDDRGRYVQTKLNIVCEDYDRIVVVDMKKGILITCFAGIPKNRLE